MRYQLLTRLPRHVATVRPYRHISHLRAYAQLAGGPVQTPSDKKGRWQTLPPLPEELFVKTSQVNVRTKETQWTIDGRWLRDQCACAECRNTDTAQRKVNVFKKPDAGRIASTRPIDAEARSYEVTFEDGHQSVMPVHLFERQINQSTVNLPDNPPRDEYWNASISSDPPTVEYEEIQHGNGMAKLLTKIRATGFCFVDKMPATPEASQSLLEQIGPIRNTHYGGFYDFTSDLSSKDTAYTSESLEPHTDTTYFTDPIGIQALHLLSHTDGEGGLSSLVDGFSAARDLFQENYKAYHQLSTTPVWGHASGNEGISIQPANGFPVLNPVKADSSPEEMLILQQVRWNTADRAGIQTEHRGELEDWYNAAEHFDKILSKPENQYWFQLTPGKMLIFDNWRVLHGRSAFTGKRRMCGGYINRDDWISKYRMTTLGK